MLIIGFILYGFLRKNKNHENQNNNNEDVEGMENCSDFDKAEKICKRCCIGFKLDKGKCIINYSFKAEYQTNKLNQTIKISNLREDLFMEMIIDNITLDFPTNDITFSLPGKHTVYALTRNFVYEDLSRMFEEIHSLISISFTEIFDTKNISYLK